jgi:hypothetical protein
MDSSKGDNCVQHLCPGAASNQCCKAKAGTTGTTGTTTGGGGSTSILPACAETGRCSVCDLLQVAINFGKYLFGIVGALVLLYFVYGGFMWLTSGGASEKIKKGKDILINSVIGLIIVFFAYGGVLFIVNAVTGGGFKWEANLQCAALPTPIEWTSPSAEQGKLQGGLPGSGAGGTTTGGTTGGTTGTGGTPTPSPSPSPSTACLNKYATGQAQCYSKPTTSSPDCPTDFPTIDTAATCPAGTTKCCHK